MVRLLGLLKLAAGAAGFAAVFWYVLEHGAEPVNGGARLNGQLAIAAGVPGAIALVGLIEFASGASFSRLAQSWDALAAWQRAVFGVLVVVAALGATAGIFLGLAYWQLI